MEADLLPTSMEAGGNFHGSRWKWMEVLTELDEATE